MSAVSAGAPPAHAHRLWSALLASVLLVSSVLTAGTGLADAAAPTTARPATTARSAAVSTAATGLASHNPFGYLGTLAFTNGFVVLSGWSIDPETRVAVRIEIRVDGVRSGAVAANRARPDVGASFPAYGPNHGYYSRFRALNGVHVVCIVGINVGAGASTTYGCRRLVVANDPVGKIDYLRLAPGGVHLTGWTYDPNSTAPTAVSIYVDRRPVVKIPALALRPDVATAHPYYGATHGFDTVLKLADGPHSVCAYAWNIAPGTANPLLGCLGVTATRSPFGALSPLVRTPGNLTRVPLAGWAVDPDTAGVIGVRITIDGGYVTAARAASATPSVAVRYPEYGATHGFGGAVSVDPGVHTVCIVAVNVGSGIDRTLGCQVLPSTGDTSPAAPTGLTAWPGNGRIDLTWGAPRAGAGAVTGYTFTANPGNLTRAVAGSVTTAAVLGLRNGRHYTFTVRATNVAGTGSAAAIAGVPSAIPLQRTPAPVSTSHYLRNLTGVATSDATQMRAMGVRDAAANPSNHRYLVLLQVGGQDEYSGGVVLSATSRFLTYAASVKAIRAYIDGYHSRQKAFAPLLLAVGTNNDMDVSASAGASWARKVVNPLISYAARYPDIALAGANDVEPGFSASAAQSRSWLSGYLGATSARFVFNGSADGCSTGRSSSRCNNGWTMADLQWLSGGAAPTRIVGLPQIYNYAMPLQWKLISLTGTAARRPRLYFGGPLTEVTACSQARSCGSIGNVAAWGSLWSAISSTPATRQSDMPHGTDLRIN
jgi:hypothetical protein